MIRACILPPLVGVGFCAVIIHYLKNNSLYLVEEMSVLELPSSKSHLLNGRPTSAEVRLPMPADVTVALVKQSNVPTTVEQESFKRATDAASKQPLPPALRAPVQPQSPKAATEQEPAIVAEPTTWRPLIDPIAEHWTHLMPRCEGLPQIYQAVLNDDPRHVAKLVSMGLSPHEKTLGGDTPLCAAVRMGRAECVRVLFLAGVDMNTPAHENQPPIAIASLRRNTEVLKALLETGVDPNTRFQTPVAKQVIDRCMIKDLRNAMESDRGITPLICCAARGDVEGAAALMRAGAKPGMGTTRYHRYPINFASTQGYLFLMRVLLGRDPDSEPNILVTIDLSSQRAWVTKSGRIINSTIISTGRQGYGTPSGRYVVTDKHRSHTSTLYHVAMPWFMRLNCSAIGLHSGHVTGRPASHGCIRLPYNKAKEFFGQVGVGDEVEIVN